jgi:hypothetical protein
MATVVLVVLSAYGALSLLWLALGALLCPVGGGQGVRLQLRLSGSGAEVEHTLRGLRWLMSAGLLAGRLK